MAEVAGERRLEEGEAAGEERQHLGVEVEVEEEVLQMVLLPPQVSGSQARMELLLQAQQEEAEEARWDCLLVQGLRS